MTKLAKDRASKRLAFRCTSELWEKLCKYHQYYAPQKSLSAFIIDIIVDFFAFQPDPAQSKEKDNDNT